MKLVIFLIGIAAAGALGYLMEPSYRLKLTGHTPSVATRKPATTPEEIPTTPPIVTEPAPAPVISVPTEEPPAPSPEPIPAESENPEPQPQEPEPAAVSSSSVVEAMQENIRSGAIKEFAFEQVSHWEEGVAEIIDGISYQTGTATYQAETIFGLKTLVAKALLTDGKVIRWVSQKTGMEIR